MNQQEHLTDVFPHYQGVFNNECSFVELYAVRLPCSNIGSASYWN
mgnify:CR=1 FL=1